MSMVEAVSKPAMRQVAAAPRTAAKTGRVAGKLLVALKRIVWQGEELDQAAQAAGLTTYQVREALSKPHVIAHVKAEREVFRAHVSAQNIHRAKEMRDTSENAMAQLGAMKFIEQIGDEQHGSSAGIRSPGFVIVVNTGSAPDVPTTISTSYKDVSVVE
jgi:hypothetical protein